MLLNVAVAFGKSRLTWINDLMSNTKLIQLYIRNACVLCRVKQLRFRCGNGVELAELGVALLTGCTLISCSGFSVNPFQWMWGGGDDPASLMFFLDSEKTALSAAKLWVPYRAKLAQLMAKN